MSSFKRIVVLPSGDWCVADEIRTAVVSEDDLDALIESNQDAWEWVGFKTEANPAFVVGSCVGDFKVWGERGNKCT